MLPSRFADFGTALVKASPNGVTIVEEAIQTAIESIDAELEELDPEKFGSGAFIPASAFGAADRSPEVALHHTRAHKVIRDTLVGVKKDLETFRQACVDARQLILDTDEASGDESRLLAARVLASASNSGYTDSSYDQATHEHADTAPTEEYPAEEDQG